MMTIQKLAMIAMLVTAWTTGSAQALAQSEGLSAVTEETSSERAADDQRGRLESSVKTTLDEQSTVGPGADAVREVFQELQGTERQRKNQDMSVENINERRNRRRQRSRQTPPPPVHVQLQPRFDFYRPASAQVASKVQTSLNRLLKNRNAGSVSVTLEQRVAVLSGKVRSEYERSLLEKLVKIEPGISRVENRIVIEANQTDSAQ
jgi:osmotically-inducible protein OsmY